MSVLKIERLRILTSILLEPEVYCKLDSNKRLQQSSFNRGVHTSIKMRRSMFKMKNLREIFW